MINSSPCFKSCYIDKNAWAMINRAIKITCNAPVMTEFVSSPLMLQMIMNLPVLGTIYPQNKTFVVMGVKIKATDNLNVSENPDCCMFL